MSISKNGANIEIDSGYADGTASGGSANTLTGSGFSADWPSRIIYITGGTGEGQSRCVKSVTDSTITVYEDWETEPDNTTTFTISYDVTDMVGLQNCTYIGPDAGKTVQFINGNVVVKAGGVFGGVKNTLILPTDKRALISKYGGFIQFGMSINGRGREGGALIQNNHGTGYVEQELAGITRFYGMDFVNKMQGTPVGANKLTRLNHFWAPQELTAYDCNFRDVVLLEDFNTDTKFCNFVGERSGLMTFSPPISSFGHKIFSGMLSARAERVLNGADLFDAQYFGDAPNDPFFDKPVFLFRFESETYYWNVKFPDGFANAFKWFRNGGNGTIYEGYSVKPIILDSSGLPISNALIALADKDGNAGWTTGKDSNFEPIKELTLTSDLNGTITNSIGNNENGLILSGDWTRVSETISSAVSYYPFTLHVKKYGIVPIKKVNLNYTERSVELLGASDNARLLATESEAAEILGITLDFTAKTIVITLDTDAQKLFDYYHYQQGQTANSTADDDIFVIDFVDIGSWSLTLDGCKYTGAIATTSTITRLNGAKATGSLTDSSGTTLPDKILTVQVNQTGADVVILEAGTDTVLASVDAQAGNDFEWVYVGAQVVDIGVIKAGFGIKYTYGYSLTGVDQSLPIGLLVDRAYE